MNGDMAVPRCFIDPRKFEEVKQESLHGWLVGRLICAKRMGREQLSMQRNLVRFAHTKCRLSPLHVDLLFILSAELRALGHTLVLIAMCALWVELLQFFLNGLQ